MFSTQLPDLDGENAPRQGGRGQQGPKPVFPTPHDVTEALIARHPGFFAPGAQVWDPCCGNWGVLEPLEKVGCITYGSDILPNPKGISAVADILTCDLPEPDLYQVIISNAPFDLLTRIIPRVVPLAPVVALMCSASFWHASTRSGVWEAFTPNWIHPLRWRPDWLGLGSPQLNVAWMVWDRSATHEGCRYEPLHRPARAKPASKKKVLMIADTGFVGGEGA